MKSGKAGLGMALKKREFRHIEAVMLTPMAYEMHYCILHIIS